MVTPAPALAIVDYNERSLMDTPQIPVHSSPALPLTPGGGVYGHLIHCCPTSGFSGHG
jgi:hypothetical protein